MNSRGIGVFSWLLALVAPRHIPWEAEREKAYPPDSMVSYELLCDSGFLEARLFQSHKRCIALDLSHEDYGFEKSLDFGGLSFGLEKNLVVRDLDVGLDENLDFEGLDSGLDAEGFGFGLDFEGLNFDLVETLDFRLDENLDFEGLD